MDQKPNHNKLTMDRFDVVALVLLGVYIVACGYGWAMGWDWFSPPWLLGAGCWLAAAAYQGKRFFQKREKGHLIMAALLLLSAGLCVLNAYTLRQNKERVRANRQKEQESAETGRREGIESAVKRIRSDGGGFGPYVRCFVELKTDWTPIIQWRGRQTIALYSLGAAGLGNGVYLFNSKEYAFAGNENRIKANAARRETSLCFVATPAPAPSSFPC